MAAGRGLKSTRDEAAAAGDRFYFTGIACAHGHLSKRYTSCRRCLACHKLLDRDAAREYKQAHYKKNKIDHDAAGRAWSAANREKSRAIKKRWRDKNPKYGADWARLNYPQNAEKMRAKSREFRAKNPEKVTASLHRWRAENPNQVRKHEEIRRRRKIENGDFLTASDIKEILKRQKGKCACCGRKAKLQMDHIMPLALGGSGDRRNFQGLCQPCNGSKHAKHPIDFNRSRGLLL